MLGEALIVAGAIVLHGWVTMPPNVDRQLGYWMGLSMICAGIGWVTGGL